MDPPHEVTELPYEIHEFSQSGAYLYITITDFNLPDITNRFVINCETGEIRVLKSIHGYLKSIHGYWYWTTLTPAEESVIQKVLEDL